MIMLLPQMKLTQFEEFLEETFSCLDMDFKDFVGFDKKYERPAEVDLLIGNPEKAKKQLGWEPKTTFKELVSFDGAGRYENCSREKKHWLKLIFHNAKSFYYWTFWDGGICFGTRSKRSNRPDWTLLLADRKI